MIGRIFSTILAFIAYSWIAGLFDPIATLVTGSVAGNQFDSSNASYLNTMATFSLMSRTGILFIGMFVATLVSIWWNPVKAALTSMSVIGLAGFIMTAAPNKAYAYAETTDKAEAYTILPNESAFWIPDVGANKENQIKFDSEQYLSENKLAAKRFVIPHAKFANSGGWAGWDLYIPTGRLIIVDRTPYSREWVKSNERGTAKSDQSFPCQSKEGINITVGVSIGASVTEEQAAKFLYRFGVTPPKGDRRDPQVIFASVYYGRSLESVMDDVGRKKVQTLVCDEITARTLDKDNEDAALIMANVDKKTREYFNTVGITLDFIGWADTFEFDQTVQKAIDDKWAAAKMAEALPVLQAAANLKIQEGLGEGLAKHGLPIVVTPEMISALLKLVPPNTITTMATTPVPTK